MVSKYISMGLSRDAVPLAVANYGDDPTKVCLEPLLDTDFYCYTQVLSLIGRGVGGELATILLGYYMYQLIFPHEMHYKWL